MTSAFLIQNELMPRKVFDASRIASRQASSNPFGDCAMTSIFRTIDIGLLPLHSARAKHERKETRPASFSFASNDSDRGNTGLCLHWHEGQREQIRQATKGEVCSDEGQAMSSSALRRPIQRFGRLSCPLSHNLPCCRPGNLHRKRGGHLGSIPCCR